MSWLVALRRTLEAEGFWCELKEGMYRGREASYISVKHGIGVHFGGCTVNDLGVVSVTASLDHPIWRAVELARQAWEARDAG